MNIGRVISIKIPQTGFDTRGIQNKNTQPITKQPQLTKPITFAEAILLASEMQKEERAKTIDLIINNKKENVTKL